MQNKFNVSAVAIIASVVFVASVTPVAAQSWYTQFLDVDNSSVAGANTGRGKPTETPSSQAQNRQDNPGRGSATGSVTENVDNESELDEDENAQTFLRRNSFSSLSEMKDLTPEERQEKIAELKSAVKEQRCEIIETNVNRRIDYYQNSHTDHLNRYQGMVVGLSKASERLSLLGYDTTELDTKIVVLQNMINEMNILQNDLIVALQSVSTAQCGEDSTDPSTKGQLAQTSVQTVRTKALEIKDYIRNEIIPTIQALRDQNVEETTENEVPEDTENDEDSALESDNL